MVYGDEMIKVWIIKLATMIVGLFVAGYISQIIIWYLIKRLATYSFINSDKMLGNIELFGMIIIFLLTLLGGFLGYRISTKLVNK